MLVSQPALTKQTIVGYAFECHAHHIVGGICQSLGVHMLKIVSRSLCSHMEISYLAHAIYVVWA